MLQDLICLKLSFFECYALQHNFLYWRHICENVINHYSACVSCSVTSGPERTGLALWDHLASL